MAGGATRLRYTLTMKTLRPLALFLLASTCFAQGLEYIKAHYTKYEYMIPMRDGKMLFTSVYVPKDTSEKYPIMLDRTPYSVAPYGADNFKPSLGPSEKFARDGFIFVYQDARGCYMSEGEFVNMRPQIDVKRGPQDVDESSDTYDTIDWLIKNVPNQNGKVGMWGISYPGFYTAAGIIDAHPALKAASPQAPIADWFIGDDFHHNGALYLPHAYRFLSGFGHPRPVPTLPQPPPPDPTAQLDAYSFFLSLGPLSNANEKYFKNDVPFWTEMMHHGAYDDYWQARNLRPHLKNIKPAVMTVGGWFDAEDLFGALNTYKEIEKNSPGANNTLVMGPWCHGCWARTERRAGQRAVRRQDLAVLPGRDRVSVLRLLAEGQSRSQAAGSIGVRNRHQSVAAGGCLAAQGRAAASALRARRWKAELRRAPGIRGGLRRIYQRSE